VASNYVVSILDFCCIMLTEAKKVVESQDGWTAGIYRRSIVMVKVTRVHSTQYIIDLAFDDSNKLQANSIKYEASIEQILIEIIAKGIESYPVLTESED